MFVKGFKLATYTFFVHSTLYSYNHSLNKTSYLSIKGGIAKKILLTTNHKQLNIAFNETLVTSANEVSVQS